MLSVIVSCVRSRHAMCISDRRRVSERHFRCSKQWKQLYQARIVVPTRKATANRQVFVHPEKTLNHRFFRRFEQTTSQEPWRASTNCSISQVWKAVRGRMGNLAPATFDELVQLLMMWRKTPSTASSR